MQTISKLLLPPPELAGCIFAGIYRDTRGAALPAADRYNHFPASPLVSVSCILHGKLTIPSKTEPVTAPDIMVMGPQDGPVTSWSPGEVTAITIGFYHDAWLHLNECPDFTTVPRFLAEACRIFSKSPEPETAWRAFCQSLAMVWREKRPNSWTNSFGMADWAKAAMARAAMGTAGTSLRSFERRLKRMSGQTRRSLAFYSTFEELHKRAEESSEQPLAAIALASGYADQSHMGRAVKRATGFTPAQLNAAIRNEEPFWCYRLLGERF